MRLRIILLATASLVISFFGSLWIMDRISPREGAAGDVPKPPLAQLPPLPPASRVSKVMAPVAITLASIRDAADRAAPRNFNGKANNPAPQLIQNADINWTAARGPISATGANDTISLATVVTGTVNAKGSLSQQAGGAISGLVGQMFGGKAGEQVGRIAIRELNANADILANVAVQARPQLSPNWRVDPNLAAQISLADTNLNASGVRLNVNDQIRPLMDKMLEEQLAKLREQARNDQTLEQTARREWTKMCRSIPLPAAAPGLPSLYLEMKPTKAVAAQPRIDATNVNLMLGIEAQTAVTTSQTKPDCPFPTALQIVPPLDKGTVNVGVPIDMSFTDVNKIISAQLKDRTFPEDNSGPVAVTVKSATVSPSGERLLISLLVNAKEKTSWFGLGADATVHVWGRPVLNSEQQTLNLADVELAVESEAAFGLLGAAARQAMPYMQKALAERATIDLKPFLAEARVKISEAMAELRKNDQGVKVDAAVTGVRLVDIAYDSKTLRIVAEADGSINVAVTQLPNF
ncbi:DUF4403 family protein [Bradyrhizobium sp. LHD-71]|uniref:DUF4403 family protein n=1 Tax=Bradyrhizobium sp. LHD-71 TaxID=3072141 RepID=UPI00280DE6D9|nr:DUF4403 family protein [Bradyrhizobium sp. LHD-71]MDQ8727793.1 DUF4403 family protein [Bradyrhizobium sp. LHD-71]